MKSFALLASLLLVSGCDSSSKTSKPAASPPAERIYPQFVAKQYTPEDCAKGGGQWRAGCIPNQPQCLTPYRDGGKQCKNSSECESKMCLIDLTSRCIKGKCVEPVIPKTGDLALGVCKFDDSSCGTFIEIKDGRVLPVYSVD